jgi:copper transport protein
VTSVVVLALTGAYQAWRGVGTPAAMPATDYGRLVLTKGLLFVALLAAALVSRRLLVRGSSLRGVAVELGLGAAVLVVTTALVSTVPARLAYAPQHRSTVTATNLAAEQVRLHLQVGPTRPGFQDLDLQVSDGSGRPHPFLSASAVLTEVEHGWGPIAVTLTPDGRGGARAEAVAVPAPGTWTLVVYVRTGPLTTFVGQDSYLVEQ